MPGTETLVGAGTAGLGRPCSCLTTLLSACARSSTSEEDGWSVNGRYVREPARLALAPRIWPLSGGGDPSRPLKGCGGCSRGQLSSAGGSVAEP